MATQPSPRIRTRIPRLVVSSRYLVPTAIRLAPYFHAYALDLPGFGKSEKPSQVLNITELSDVLADWMQALQDCIEEQLPYVQVPALVVRGVYDTIVPQRRAKEATRLFPQGQLVVIPRAAHVVNYDSPVELTRVIRAFMRFSRIHAVGPNW